MPVVLTMLSGTGGGRVDFARGVAYMFCLSRTILSPELFLMEYFSAYSHSALPYRHVAVFRFSALGDVAMTVPVVYEVCRAYPGIRFTLFTKKTVAPLFVYPPDNLTVFPVDTKGRYRGFAGLWRLYRDMKSQGIDAIADLHNVFRSLEGGFFFDISGVKRAILDKGRAAKRRLVARKKPLHIQPLPTSFDRYRQVFARLGFETPKTFRSVFDDRHLPLPLPEGIESRREGEFWIGVAPFAKHEGKIYPLDRSESLVARLSQREDCRVFLMGGGGEEADLLGGWAEKYPRVVSLAGKRLGFAVELSMMSRMTLVVSMDSANMHLASMAGTPVVSVWGQTHPYAGFLGWRQSKENIIQLSDLSCRPCSIFGNKPCYRGDYACMQELSVERIWNRVEEILRREKK